MSFRRATLTLYKTPKPRDPQRNWSGLRPFGSRNLELLESSHPLGQPKDRHTGDTSEV